MQSLIDDLKKLHGALMGGQLVEITSADEVLGRLVKGETDMPLVLRWDEEPHSVVLKGLDSHQVLFYNPAGPGEELESFSLEEFRERFREGAVCLVPVNL